MTQQEIQEKRDGLALLELIADDKARPVILRAFEAELADYLAGILNPEAGDADVLALRYQAMGVVRAMQRLGVTVQKIANLPALRRAGTTAVRQSFGEDLTG